ncbi:MAG TPA: DUF4390 domain-containing protein [Gammaproteobacteria bacterium]|nr:DUF4390 domain-containing protein [Gammaproteobacteria bacterium]
MHVSRKSDVLAVPVSLPIILFMLLCAPVLADNQKGIIIRHANGLIVNGVYRVDAEIDYQLSEEATQALLHGVSLQMDIEFQVKMKRPWLWNKMIKESVLSYRLEHHPLSGNFLVTNLATGERDQFQNLAGALENLGKISNYPLVTEDRLQPDKNYLVEIRARLNKQALPAPLRPLAYLSSRWHVASPGYEWMMQ